jgi:predicted alpha-1,6-mannanase (GH76 family)
MTLLKASRTNQAPGGRRRGWIAVTASALLACGMGMACSSASPNVAPSVDAQEASRSIGEAGGILLTPDGSSVSVPRGALTHDATISIASDPNAAVPADVTPVGLTYLLGPEGQHFDVPVTVTLAFDPAELPRGASANDIVVFTAPRGGSDYAPMTTTVVDSLHVSVETSHFSDFVPVIVKKQAVDALTDMLDHFWSAKRHGAHGELIPEDGHFLATGYWTNAQALDAVLDGVESSKGTKFTDWIPLVVKGNGEQFASGSDSDGWLEPNYGQVYFDDIAWMALALIRAHDDAITYHLTGANKYLETAALLVDYTMDHGQSYIGGKFAGLWWNTRHDDDPKKGQAAIPTKVTVANFGSALAAARLSERRAHLTARDIEDGGLHDLRDEATYRAFAIQVYDFWHSTMVKTSCSFTGAWVYDSLQQQKVEGHEIWTATPDKSTYDQGIGIGAALAIAAIDSPSAKDAHIAEARAMADYLVTYETLDNVLHDGTATVTDGKLTGCTGNCEGFKGIAYRYLVALYRETGIGKYYSVLQSSQAAIFANAYDTARQEFGTNWNQPVRTQPNFSTPKRGTPINYGGELNLAANASAAMAAEMFANPSLDRSPTASWEPTGGDCTPPPPPPPPPPTDGGTCGGSVAGCVQTFGSGSSAVCDFNWSTFPGFACSDDPGYSPGSCSTTNLDGCCITTTVSTTTAGPVTTTQATCYYNGDSAAKAACTGGSKDVTLTWSACPP